MKSAIKELIKQYFLPRWIVLIFDQAVMGSVFIFVTFLIVNFSFEKVILYSIFPQFVVSAVIFFVVYLIIRPHHNIIINNTLKDFSTIVLALFIGSASLFGLSIIGRGIPDYTQYIIPYSVIITGIQNRLLINFTFSSRSIQTNSSRIITI